jgi:predicted nucleic acid-binding protein
LIVLSAPATTIQLGLVLQAAVVIVAEKLSAKLNTCDRAMMAAWSLGGRLRTIHEIVPDRYM